MLKRFRQKLGLTQAELAGRVNIPQNVLSQIENGKIYAFPAWRKRIAKALKVREEEIFNADGRVRQDSY